MASRSVVVRAGSGEPMVLHGNPSEFMLTAAGTEGRLEWIVGTVEFGAGPPYHIHHEADEVKMVLAGELKFKVDGEFYDLRPGDVAFTPRGVPHTFTNVHRDQPVRLLALYTPAGLQAFLQQWDEAFAGGAPNPTVIAELAARYGQEAVGPPLAVELGLLEPVH